MGTYNHFVNKLTSNYFVKQLSEPHVYQGPSPTTQTTTLWIHTTTVWIIWSQNTTENNFQSSMLTRARPLQHKQPLCKHTQSLCGPPPIIQTTNFLAQTSTTQSITVYVGTYNHFICKLTSNYWSKTTFRAPCSPGSAPHNTNNHSVDSHNHCVCYLISKHYWRHLSEPHVHQGPPLQHKQPLCKHTQPLCGLLDLKTQLKINLQSPIFTRACPPQHEQPLCGHT